MKGSGASSSWQMTQHRKKRNVRDGGCARKDDLEREAGHSLFLCPFVLACHGRATKHQAKPKTARCGPQIVIHAQMQRLDEPDHDKRTLRDRQSCGHDLQAQACGTVATGTEAATASKGICTTFSCKRLASLKRQHGQLWHPVTEGPFISPCGLLQPGLQCCYCSCACKHDYAEKGKMTRSR